MLESLLVLFVGAVLVGCLCYGRFELVDGKKHSRYKPSLIAWVAGCTCICFAFTLLIAGGDTIVRFSDKYVLQAGDSLAWSLLFVAPVVVMMMSCIACILLGAVGRLAYCLKRKSLKSKRDKY